MKRFNYSPAVGVACFVGGIVAFIIANIIILNMAANYAR